MKTLDEVIMALEDANNGIVACNGDTECGYHIIGIDALHYLKMYRSDQLEWEGTSKAWAELGQAKFAEYDKAKQKYIEKLKELDIGTLNDPLTMEYFSKQIDTEPIWCEKLGEWYLFLAYDDGENEIQLMSDKGDIETFSEEDLEKYPLYRRK